MQAILVGLFCLSSPKCLDMHNDRALKRMLAQGDMAKPFYAIHSKPFKTGTPDAYLPKGAWKNPQKRNWTKVQTWQPPSS